MSRANPSWGHVDRADAEVIAAYLLAATGAQARVVAPADPVGYPMPCRDCNGGARAPIEGCVTCDRSGTVVRIQHGQTLPDLVGEVEEDTIVHAARALLASKGASQLVVDPVMVINGFIRQQELGAARTHQALVEEFRAGGLDAVLGWTYEADLEAVGLGAGPVKAGPSCESNREESPVAQEVNEHQQNQFAMVGEVESAVHMALAEVARVRAAADRARQESCGEDCCPREVETEDTEAALVEVERQLRGVLRVAAVRQGRLEVLAEEVEL